MDFLLHLIKRKSAHGRPFLLSCKSMFEDEEKEKKKIFTGIIYRFINFLKNVFVRVGEVQVFYPVYFMYD